MNLRSITWWSQKKYLDPDLLFVRSVDLVLTEKCSLKRKDCANLMQYYENPVNIDKQELIEDLEDLMVVADEVNEIPDHRWRADDEQGLPRGIVASGVL